MPTSRNARNGPQFVRYVHPPLAQTFNEQDRFDVAEEAGYAAFQWFAAGGFAGKEKPTNPHKEVDGFAKWGWEVGFERGELEWFCT